MRMMMGTMMGTSAAVARVGMIWATALTFAAALSCATVAAKPSPTSLDGRIISLAASGARTSLVLNRGRHHGVKRGMSGNIPGVGAFTIQEVYQFRSKAIFNGTVAQVGAQRVIRIALK